jgi:hypothetical protein
MIKVKTKRDDWQVSKRCHISWRTPTKNFTKIVAKNEAIGIDACRKIKRRTRSWSTPHATFAISPREVDQPRRRNLAEKHAWFNRIASGSHTFFA